MTALLTADMCPTCTQIHGQPTDWPRCPSHGHLLYQLRITAAGFTYTCPAWKCRHTHTQPERATMTATHEAARAALAIRDGQDAWDGKQLAALTQLGIEGAPEADLAVFLHRCQATGLDPFASQITMIKRGGKWTIQTEIDGYRVIAHRAARRDGVTLSYGDTFWWDKNGARHAMWVEADPPAAASVIVYRDNKPFPGMARFASFAAVDRDGKLMRQWATMPEHMIAKCAEAQALRKAFPHDLDGIATADEAAHLAAEPPPAARVTAHPVAERQPLPRDAATLREEIRKEFDRLGLEDHEERLAYACKLANRDPAQSAAALTVQDLRFVLDSLRDCADTGILAELVSPSPEAP